MNLQRTLLATAVLSAISPLAFADPADQVDPVVPKVVVTATPFRSTEGDQILTPAKILAGDELRDKIGASLGETLSQELGVSASGFGPGASRPIIRGMEGSRVKMLENGMAVTDVSGLSNDHAVASEGAIARQIEILRGPAALLYGSGAIGGLVNVVNERIPTHLEPKPTGQAELRLGSVDDARNVSGSVDGASGALGFHVDGSVRHTDDYKIPGNRGLGDPGSPSGRLPHSFTRQKTAGFGASLIGPWGHAGASVGVLDNLYGIPSEEGAKIDQHQDRFDVDSLFEHPLAGVESIKFKMGYTNYRHTEIELDGTPATHFKNRALESRWELAHAPLGGWNGSVGMQAENTHFSAMAAADGSPDTVPVTHSTSTAAFIVEQRDFGPVKVNAGLRLETVKRTPVGNTARSFHLTSYSVGGLWPFTPGYGAGLTASVAQRAPATEELYSGGPHDATATFDVGDPALRRETSRNVELSLQKAAGLLRWKGNLFLNKVADFVYGSMDGELVDDEGNPGGTLRRRVFTQAGASLHGAELEVAYNQAGLGGSARAFADSTRGTLDAGGSLPLQPAVRFGIETGYRSAELRTGLSLVRTQSQQRLASFETSPTPGYTMLNANLSWTQHLGQLDLTWFVLGKNLLNQDVRLSTSVLKDVSPLPGRNFSFGVRTRF